VAGCSFGDGRLRLDDDRLAGDVRRQHDQREVLALDLGEIDLFVRRVVALRRNANLDDTGVWPGRESKSAARVRDGRELGVGDAHLGSGNGREGLAVEDDARQRAPGCAVRGADGEREQNRAEHDASDDRDDRLSHEYAPAPIADSEGDARAAEKVSAFHIG
jgi:hypothetical protein